MDLAGVEDYIIPGQKSQVVTKADQENRNLNSTTSRFSSTLSIGSIANILPKTSRGESRLSSNTNNPLEVTQTTTYKETA